MAGAVPHSNTKGLVDLVHWSRVIGGQFRLNIRQVLDLEADVMDAAIVLAALSGYIVILEVQNGHIDVAVAEEISVGVGAFQLGNLTQSEDIFVKCRSLFCILSGNGDVLNLRHLATSPAGIFRYMI